MSGKKASAKKGHFERKPCPLARCKVAAGGNTYAGELLYQLSYRFARKEALQSRYGKMWCAQTGKHWQMELAFTKEQYKTALRVLKELGLVECKLAKFSEHQLFKITWLRLSDAGQAIFQGGNAFAWMTPTAGVKGTSAEVEMTPAHGVDHAITGNTNSGKTSGKMKAESLAESQTEIGVGSTQVEGGKGEASNCPKKKAIEAAWRVAHEKHRPDLSVSEFVGTDWHFAAQIAVRLGKDAAAVIDLVVKRWEDFTMEVAGQHKYFKHPERPTLGYVAAFGNVAKDFWKNPPTPEASDGWSFQKLAASAQSDATS